MKQEPAVPKLKMLEPPKKKIEPKLNGDQNGAHTIEGTTNRINHDDLQKQCIMIEDLHFSPKIQTIPRFPNYALFDDHISTYAYQTDQNSLLLKEPMHNNQTSSGSLEEIFKVTLS